MAAGNTFFQSVPRAGLRDTLCFKWKKEGETIMPREIFGKEVLLGLFKLKHPEVMCFQTNSLEKAYDVSFITSSSCKRVEADCARLAGERQLAGFEVINLDRGNFRVITIHCYNPYISDQTIASFLGRYAEILAGPRNVNDTLGFWTGKRQYQVLLKQDPDGHEGFMHPPAYFSFGADRGYLFYSRQPPFCRKCRCSGHTDLTCGLGRCRFCRSAGHETRECPVPKKCHRCGKEGHLIKDCKERPGTYAAAAGARRGEGEKRREEPQPAQQQEPQTAPQQEAQPEPQQEAQEAQEATAEAPAAAQPASTSTEEQGAGEAQGEAAHADPAQERREEDVPAQEGSSGVLGTSQELFSPTGAQLRPEDISSTAEEVGLLATADLQTPMEWGDSPFTGEKRPADWEPVSGKKRSATGLKEGPQPEKVQQGRPQQAAWKPEPLPQRPTTLKTSNRFQVLGEERESSVEMEMEVDVGSPSRHVDSWDSRAFAEVLGMSTGKDSDGEEGRGGV